MRLFSGVVYFIKVAAIQFIPQQYPVSGEDITKHLRTPKRAFCPLGVGNVRGTSRKITLRSPLSSSSLRSLFLIQRIRRPSQSSRGSTCAERLNNFQADSLYSSGIPCRTRALSFDFSICLPILIISITPFHVQFCRDPPYSLMIFLEVNKRKVFL